MDQALLLYDEDCGFCRFSVELILKWDRHSRLRAATIQGPEGKEHLAGLTEEQRLASWHLITPGGQRFSGGDAAAPLADLLPVGAPLAALFRTYPSATNDAYQWVASHRTDLGRWIGQKACSVDPSDPSRRGERPPRPDAHQPG